MDQDAIITTAHALADAARAAILKEWVAFVRRLLDLGASRSSASDGGACSDPIITGSSIITGASLSHCMLMK